MFDNLFFVQAAGDSSPTLTIGGLPVCVIGQKSQESVGEGRLSLAPDFDGDYFQAMGAAARERLAE